MTTIVEELKPLPAARVRQPRYCSNKIKTAQNGDDTPDAAKKCFVPKFLRLSDDIRFDANQHAREIGLEQHHFTYMINDQCNYIYCSC